MLYEVTKDYVLEYDGYRVSLKTGALVCQAPLSSQPIELIAKWHKIVAVQKVVLKGNGVEAAKQIDGLLIEFADSKKKGK